MTHLGIDPATTLGWGRGHLDMEAPTSGIVNLPSYRTDSMDFLIAGRDWCEGMIEDGVTSIACEGVYVGKGADFALAVSQLIGVFRMLSYELLDRDIMMVAVNSWRLSLLGFSQAPAAIGHIEGLDKMRGKERKNALERKKRARRAWLKAQVILECERRGWHVSANDNRADGLGIMHHLMVKEIPSHAIANTPLFEGSTG